MKAILQIAVRVQCLSFSVQFHLPCVLSFSTFFFFFTLGSFLQVLLSEESTFPSAQSQNTWCVKGLLKITQPNLLLRAGSPRPFFTARVNCWILANLVSKRNPTLSASWHPAWCFLSPGAGHGGFLHLLSFLSTHFSSLLMTLWMAAKPSSVSTTLLSFVSLLRVHSFPTSRSLLKMLRSIGPVIIPWHTPVMTGSRLNFLMMITILWVQLFSQCSNPSHCPYTTYNLTACLWRYYWRQSWKPCLCQKEHLLLLVHPSHQSHHSHILNIIEVDQSRSLVRHVFSFENPPWLFLFILFCLIWPEMYSRSIFSLTFPETEVKLTILSILFLVFPDHRMDIYFLMFLRNMHHHKSLWLSKDNKEWSYTNIISALIHAVQTSLR